jgi:L-alanine-DL-glutamate epimerase-like enolase superfamily enzyme
MNRRDFVRNSSLSAGSVLLSDFPSPEVQERRKPIRIDRVDSCFEIEPLIKPFGFKGNSITKGWQTASYLESSSGKHSIGLCSQGVLWSDSKVFESHSANAADPMMYILTERALQMIKGQTFTNPIELLDHILPEVYEFGKKITNHPDLRKTFALNALVGVDNAAWLLYAAENGLKTFDEIIPKAYKPALSNHHEKIAAIPLCSYSVSVEEIESLVKSGYFFMKIKIGQSGTQQEMLEKDMARISAIHRSIGNVHTSWSESGKLPYYFDANGRYEKKETLLRLLDHCTKIGALDQIVLIEEPFDEEMEIDVSDIPVRLAADESAHTDLDAERRMQMGYKAIALKAIAKTLSMTMKIAQKAYERKVPCFCADLTVNPILVEWNKNVAARLSSFPGLKDLGLLESNGHQNYRNWEAMMSYHPRKEAPWVKANQGIYEVNPEFYRSGGGIFDPSPHYEELFSRKT